MPFYIQSHADIFTSRDLTLPKYPAMHLKTLPAAFPNALP